MMLASSVCHPSYNNAVHIHDARFGTEMASNATCMFGMQKEVESPMTDVGNHPIPTNANLICAAISQHFAALKNNIKQPQLSLKSYTRNLLNQKPFGPETLHTICLLQQTVFTPETCIPKMVVTPETFYTNHIGQQNPINTPQNSCTPVSFATEAVYPRNLSTKTCTFMTRT